MDELVRPALLIIRTWREDASDRFFRAQVRVVADVSSGSSSTMNLADPDEVLEVVRAFLRGESLESV